MHHAGFLQSPLRRAPCQMQHSGGGIACDDLQRLARPANIHPRKD